jgi:hypothetical protein
MMKEKSFIGLTHVINVITHFGKSMDDQTLQLIPPMMSGKNLSD